MKKIVMVSFIVLLFSLPLLSKATVKFKQTKVDFGEVDQGKSVKIDFEFENTGDSVLIIKSVKAACGCTAVELEKREYQPGEKGVISVKFDSRQYQGKTRKDAWVYTNDEENAAIRLEISGQITLKYFSVPEIDQETLEFKDAVAGKRYEKTINVRNSGTTDLKVVDLIHDPEIIPEFSRHVIAPDSEAQLKVTFKPLLPGKSVKWLRLRTDSVKRRQILIKIKAEVNE
jgi:hypothetical protein